MAKRVNWAKQFDKLCAGTRPENADTRAGMVMRAALQVAADTEHKDYGPQSRWVMDQIIGRAAIKMELDVPQGKDLGLNSAVMVMLGVSSLEAEFTNEDGEIQQINLTRKEAEGDGGGSGQ